MRIGEIVGGAALVGVAVLIGITLTDDQQPETITSDTSPFVFDEGTTTTTTTSAAPSTTEAPTSTVAAATTTTVRRRSRSTVPTTVPTTTGAPTTTLIPPEARATIPVRVLNGGAPPGSATLVTAMLRDAGFDPPSAADASTLVDATTILYAPGGELAALTVNDLIAAPADNVVAASDDDANWAAFGADLMVLVVLGPPQG